MQRRAILSAPLAAFLAATLPAAPAAAAERQLTTTDGVRLHYTDVGNPGAPTLVFIPGWTMPAWVFQPQMERFAGEYRVVALDPRGQGSSEVPATGYDHLRRGADIADLLAQLGNRQVVLVGWSLGVLDCLAYVQQRGDDRLAGLVLLDNSVGEDPPPPIRPRVNRPPAPRLEREEQMRRFVRGMFHRPPRPQYVEALTQATLVTPPAAAAALLSYPVPRTYWRDALYTVRKPVLYAVTPRLSAQAANLQLRHPMAETAVFDSGHAFFVEEEDRFNALLEDWMRRRVWRGGL